MAVETSVVRVPRADGAGVMESFHARPGGAGPFPGLIVIHEIYGLNDNIRGIASRFAAEGYENTRHSFFGKQRTPFEVDASKDAWRRMLSFFEDYVRKC